MKAVVGHEILLTDEVEGVAGEDAEGTRRHRVRGLHIPGPAPLVRVGDVLVCSELTCPELDALGVADVRGQGVDDGCHRLGCGPLAWHAESGANGAERGGIHGDRVTGLHWDG